MLSYIATGYMLLITYHYIAPGSLPLSALQKSGQAHGVVNVNLYKIKYNNHIIQSYNY